MIYFANIVTMLTLAAAFLIITRILINAGVLLQ